MTHEGSPHDSPLPLMRPRPRRGGHEGMRGASPRPLMRRSWLRQMYFLFFRKGFPARPSALRPPSSGVLRPNSISVYPPPWYPFREMGGSINSDCVAARIAAPPGARRGVYMARKPTGVAECGVWDYNIYKPYSPTPPTPLLRLAAARGALPAGF